MSHQIIKEIQNRKAFRQVWLDSLNRLHTENKDLKAALRGLVKDIGKAVECNNKGFPKLTCQQRKNILKQSLSKYLGNTTSLAKIQPAVVENKQLKLHEDLVQFKFTLTAQESQDFFMVFNSFVTAKLSSIRKVMVNPEFSEDTKNELVASLEGQIEYIKRLIDKIQPEETK